VRLWIVGFALVLAGCGASDRGDVVSQVAARFLAATSAGDTNTACGLLTPQTREDLTTSDGQSCTDALPADRLPGAPLGVAEVWSDWAKVDTDAGALFLTEMDSGWRVSAAGCTPRGESQPYRCVVGD
jgi:hypothetical protein